MPKVRLRFLFLVGVMTDSGVLSSA